MSMLNCPQVVRTAHKPFYHHYASLRCAFSFVAFEIHGGNIPVVTVYLTSTGEKVYGGPRRDRMICEL